MVDARLLRRVCFLIVGLNCRFADDHLRLTASLCPFCGDHFSSVSSSPGKPDNHGAQAFGSVEQRLGLAELIAIIIQLATRPARTRGETTNTKVAVDRAEVIPRYVFAQRMRNRRLLT
jgi:hypothetical protein